MARIFPSTADYISAIENANAFVLDPILKEGRPRRSKSGEILFYSGGWAKVFVFDCGAKTYALRCWTTGIRDSETLYNAASDFLRRQQLPYFIEFAFVRDGILVNGHCYPIVRMKWAEALSLREFIGANLQRPNILKTAAENFLTMARMLHNRRIAHEDLNCENVMVAVSEAGPQFVLIDYDTLFVPGLASYTVLGDTGFQGFKHPNRVVTSNAEADYFAELVIYLTLHAIANEPQLWADYQMGVREKELIFEGEDFESALPTQSFRRLRQLSPFVSKLTLILWNFTRCGDVRALIPIEEAAEICRT
jgi:hypothetical protein